MAPWRLCRKKEDNSYIIYGRSDATLNPGGVRLGTSEIYSVLEKFKNITECLAVGQNWDNDVRIILFVVLKKNQILSDKLKKKFNTISKNLLRLDMYLVKLLKFETCLELKMVKLWK